MRSRGLLVSVICLLPASLLLGQNQSKQSQDLQQLYQDYYEFILRDSPETATSVGRADYNDRWADSSPAARQHRVGELRRFRERLGTFSPAGLSEAERLNYRLFEWDVRNRIDREQTIGTYSVVNHFTGGHLDVFAIQALAPANTVKDYENQITRITALPQWAEGTILAANESIAKHQVQPRLVTQLMLKQLDIQMRPDAPQSPLLKAFTRFPDTIPPQEQARLRTEAVRAYNDQFRPAWKKLQQYLATTYLPASRETIGISQTFNGAEMYAYLVRAMTTTSFAPQQIHELGLQEVKRIQGEMSRIRQELGFTGTPQEFADQVLNAAKFRFHSEEEIVAHGREIAKRIDPELPRLFKTLPRIPYGVQAIPPDRARTSAPYYQRPALDGTRAGNFFLRTVDPEKQSNCCMESLILHESVPGHHLQIALAQEMPDVPNFRKILFLPAFSEGWGLYAETLGKSLNMYSTPYERYGQLDSELFRAQRLVLDTGIHSMGWTRERAVTALSDGSARPRDFIESEVDRYIAMPGQALAYKMGGLRIQQVRALAEKELGAKFNIRDFHDAVLRNGALPLDILEEEIKTYIQHAK